MIDFDSLRNAVKAGKNIIYSKGQGDVPFFELRKQEGWNPDEKRWEADIRLVVKSKTKGYGFRIIHPYVGWPGKDVKSFTCPKYIKPDNECVLCKAVELTDEEDVQNTFIDFPGKRDGIPVIKRMSVADILKSIRPEQRLIFIVCEPAFLDNDQYDKKLRGIQVWFVQKRTLITRMLTMMSNFPPDHFSNPQHGASIRITFTKDAPALEMYQVMPYRVMPISHELCESAPDAESFTSKIRSNDEMLEKLREMLPGVDL